MGRGLCWVWGAAELSIPLLCETKKLGGKNPPGTAGGKASSAPFGHSCVFGLPFGVVASQQILCHRGGSWGLLRSSDSSLIAAVCAEAVPDPAFVFAGRDLEELQGYQQGRECGRDGSLRVWSIPCVLLARCWVAILSSTSILFYFVKRKMCFQQLMTFGIHSLLRFKFFLFSF